MKRVARANGRLLVETEAQRLEADNVVIAMATFQQPRMPAFAGEIRSDVVQLHSREYRNPAQLRAGKVLVVGAGNSGAEIAIELARAGHAVVLAGRDVGHIPFRISR